MNHLDNGDIELSVKLAGCSLAESPGDDNWVDKAGGLPEYICEMARAIKKSGKSTSQAIAIAVSRIKKLAVSGEGDTKAKAAKAIAQWEKMKAGSSVKASHSHLDDLVFLANKPGDGQRNVASYAGVKKYNKPMGAPLGEGGYKGRSAMGQLKQVTDEFDDNLAEAKLANWEVAHGYVTEANPGDQVTVTSKSGKSVTYVKQSSGEWKSEVGMRTNEHLIDLVNHDLVAKWDFKIDPVKTAAAEKAKEEAMWAKVTDDQLKNMIDSYKKVIASKKYGAADNAGLQKMIDAAQAELNKRKAGK